MVIIIWELVEEQRLVLEPTLLIQLISLTNHKKKFIFVHKIPKAG